ncbi:MAG: hypothetical protein KAZ45_00140 [Arenimonas sp.]|nr:hypothetical protein [Arenimonas sp.]
MALSMKNTLASLTLSSVMLFAAYLTGDKPMPFNFNEMAASHQIPLVAKADARVGPVIRKQAKRAFTTPYYSFGKSNIRAGVRQ